MMTPKPLETLSLSPVSTIAAPPLVPLLNHLRLVALACRSAAYTDVFEACAMLSLDRRVAEDAHAKALMRGLSQVLDRRPVLYRPGVAELSFDEAWLLRLIESQRAGDADSYTFLLHSRVPQRSRRIVAFLINSIARRMGEY